MERLTTNKDVSEMGMCELAHNGCYIKDGVARYRDYETDIDARDLTRELAWSLTDIELSRNDDEFDEEMLDNLQYDITKELIGLIALFYRNLWAMADLREKLKRYEDEEEQGLLMRFPCKVGDMLYYPEKEFNIVIPVRLNEIIIYFLGLDTYSYQCNCCSFDECGDVYEDYEFDLNDIGKTVFLTQEEAEQKLKEMENK